MHRIFLLLRSCAEKRLSTVSVASRLILSPLLRAEETVEYRFIRFVIHSLFRLHSFFLPTMTTTATTEPGLHYRPRFLYASTFAWISITGGRFLAPFLEHEAHLSAKGIGACLALQQAIVTIAGSAGGSWADARERKYPGQGRAQVMGVGVICASVAFLLHSVRYILPFAFLSSNVWHVSLQCVFALSTAFVFPVLDGMTLDFLEKHPDLGRSDYGKERLYGAISWAITNLLLAPLLDWVGFGICYPLGFIATLGLLTTLMLYVRGQSQQQRQLQKHRSDIVESKGDLEATEEQEVAVNKDDAKIPLHVLLRLLVASSYGAAFLFCVLCISSGQAVVDNMVFLFFEFLGSSYTVMGLTVVLTVAFEIPIFQIAPYLLDKLGAGALLLLACLCYIVRAVGYTLIPQGHILYVLLLEPLHGVTYGCTQTAIVDFVAQAMPSGYEASGQGLAYLFRGIGSVAGLFLGGWAEDTVGPRLMYRISSLTVLIGSTVFGLALLRSPRELTHDVLPQSDLDLTTSESLSDEDEAGGGVELKQMNRID